MMESLADPVTMATPVLRAMLDFRVFLDSEEVMVLQD